MAKNPGLDFALQESTPLPGTYRDALPLGPLMDLSNRDGVNTFTPERAAQSLDYLRDRAREILADPDAVGSDTALKSYSHDTVSAGNLLAAHHFPAEAEEAYRLALQLWPGNPEPIGGLADVLVSGGRAAEARQLLETFTQNHPDQLKTLERISAGARALLPMP